MSGRAALHARDGQVLWTVSAGVPLRRQDLRLRPNQETTTTPPRRPPRWLSLRRQRPWTLSGGVLPPVEDGLAQGRAGPRPVARRPALGTGRPTRTPRGAGQAGRPGALHLSVHSARGGLPAHELVGLPSGFAAASGRERYRARLRGGSPHPPLQRSTGGAPGHGLSSSLA